MVKSKKANSCFDFKINKILKSKCSQANVIVIILLILISITAIFILWNILSPLIKEKAKEVEAKGEVLTVNLEVKEVILFVTGASKVSVRRGVGKGEIDELKFVFYDEQENSYVETKKDVLSELETKTYYFSPPQNLGKIKSVSVFPVFGKSVGLESESKTNKILEIPKGLVSWWRFDGNSEDFVGNNHCSVASIVEDSEREKVASFDGEVVNCGNNEELNINNKIAISFWVKTNSDGGIIKKGDGNKNYEVSLNEGKVNFSYTKGALKSGVSDSKINDGKWHHVVLSRDWSGDEYLRIYIEGNLDKIVSMLEVPNINAENVLIGNFNGLIDEVMFFNESLSKLGVEALYNNQKK